MGSARDKDVPGAGATLSDHTTGETPGPHDPPAPRLGAHRSVLIVDDERTIRELLIAVFADLPGWAATAVPDGTEALATLATLRPDLLVLDVNLPGLTGLEVYQRLRAQEALTAVPVIFMTASLQRAPADLVGPYRWVNKPFSLEEMHTAAATLLGLDES